MGALKTGGQGSVYKGRRIGEIITAIKLLPTPIYSESEDDKNFISFQNEVRKLKKVNEEPNPNVVKILSSGITDSGNFPFIEMEFIEGPDLEDLLKPPNPPLFSIKEVMKVADQLSSALAHCHKVDVRHGDIKSNNVKFNTHTGNYILLDFGLSVMSNEERRSSLRRAGAIEFMAPEQNEGQMLFQTDVYSFGVVMYELLAGTVPFPLRDKGESARNVVMLSHMETPPPDVLMLRQQALPAFWVDIKKQHEMEVPEWLVKMIYKCLEKKPENRFANGVELHDFIWQNSIRTAGKVEVIYDQLTTLQQENKKLLHEKELLEQRLLQYQQEPNDRQSNGRQLNDRQSNDRQSNYPKPEDLTKPTITPLNAPQQNVSDYIKKAEEPSVFSLKGLLIMLGIITGTIVLVYVLVKAGNNQQAVKDKVASEQLAKKRVTSAARRTTEIPNKDVSIRLNEAKQLLGSNKLSEALAVYKNLSQQQVPEAMYVYAKLALQNRNRNINCGQAFQLLTNAANTGYAPAKRTLGFLYSFADDNNALKSYSFYERCRFIKDVPKGSKMLMEATLQGDTAAVRLLDELNAKAQQEKN